MSRSAIQNFMHSFLIQVIFRVLPCVFLYGSLATLSFLSSMAVAQDEIEYEIIEDGPLGDEFDEALDGEDAILDQSISNVNGGGNGDLGDPEELQNEGIEIYDEGLDGGADTQTEVYEEELFDAGPYTETEGFEEEGYNPPQSADIIYNEQQLEQTGLVEQEILALSIGVEISDIVANYKSRRNKFGYYVSVGYSLYTPADYEPNFDPGTSFEDQYGSQGLIELLFNMKYHMLVGSLGIGLGASYMKASSKSTATVDSELTVVPIKAEALLVLDTITPEPLVAPYGIFGLYSALYTETQGTNSFNGNTGLAFYYGVGVNLQLDWLEPRNALGVFLDHGLENTFLYLEGKIYSDSSSAADPVLGSGFTFAGGARLEF